MMRPIRCYVGVSQDSRMIQLARFLHIPLRWSHVFWLFTFPSSAPTVFEASWKGIAPAPWDRAHKADRWALYADDRMTPEAVGRLWAFCLGSEGKIYEYVLLVRLALRLAWEAWRRVRGLVRGRGGVAQVCSSFVESSSQAIFGEGYANRPDPTPDEIIANPHLHFYIGGKC